MGKRAYGAGPLNSYNGDFTVSANIGDPIKIEHFNETVGYIELINSTGLSAQ